MKCCFGCLCKVGNLVRMLHFLLTAFVLYVLTASESTGKPITASCTESYACWKPLAICRAGGGGSKSGQWQ